MTANTTAESRVVVIAAMDRTPASEAVLHTATSLAQGIAGAELHLVHVITVAPEPVAPSMSAPARFLEEGRAWVDGVAARAAERFKGRVAAHLAVGDATREILQIASDLEADLVVVGSHGKGAIERMLAGSVSQSVAKKARCAVLIARPKEYAAEDAPSIAPPCPQCLEVQRATNGEKLWCPQHAARHVQGRVHYEIPPSFGVGSMFIRPEG